jgi:hypothetical protein
MTSKLNIDDVLVDDTEIYNQKYFVLSYLLPGKTNELTNPVIKMRGSFKTYEEAEKRIQKLKSSDKFFNMYICEVGKWGSLVSDEELLNSDEVDTVYRNEELNEIFRKYKENRRLADEEHLNRKELMKKKAIEESSQIFQRYLTFLDDILKEYKAPQNTTMDVFEEYKKSIKDVDGYLKFFTLLRTCDSEYYLQFKENSESKTMLNEIINKVKTFF